VSVRVVALAPAADRLLVAAAHAARVSVGMRPARGHEIVGLLVLGLLPVAVDLPGLGDEVRVVVAVGGDLRDRPEDVADGEWSWSSHRP
jgi:hypothetical protein